MTITGRGMKIWLAVGIFVVAHAAHAKSANEYRVYIDDKCFAHCIVVEGGIGEGLVREVERMIEANPHIKRIWLQSGGGWVNQGWWLYKLIRDNEMDTFARDCWSACTLAFIGGKNRTLDFYGTGLGFHKVSRDGDITANSISAQGKWHRAYKNAGVKKWFLKKMFDASPYNMWHPTRNELIDAGVVTQQP